MLVAEKPSAWSHAAGRRQAVCVGGINVARLGASGSNRANARRGRESRLQEVDDEQAPDLRPARSHIRDVGGLPSGVNVLSGGLKRSRCPGM
jgi:hypothetical protein